jgi:hypothetical protein
MLDSSPGRWHQEQSADEQAGVKAVFQGGEKNSVADDSFTVMRTMSWV